MEIKKFINTISNFKNLENKEQIPYFVYFLQEIQKEEGVTQSSIKKCFDDTDIHISINLSIYFKENVKMRNKIKPLYLFRNNKYFLESSAKEVIKKKLKVKEEPKDDEIIIHSKLNDEFYDRLISEINNSYYYEIYTGCFILARKLFENMILDILRKNFKQEKNLYQNPNNKKVYNDFSVLLNNLEKKKADLGFTVPEVESVISKLNLYRIEANSKTHSIVNFGKKEELSRYSVEETFDLLKRIWKV